MKKSSVFCVLSILLISVFVLGISYQASAEETKAAAPAAGSSGDRVSVPQDRQSYRLDIGNKAARGVKNVMFGWTELPKSVVDVTKDTRNPFLGLFVGGFKGVCNGFARTASGICDVATCGIKNTEAPLMQPEMDVFKTK